MNYSKGKKFLKKLIKKHLKEVEKFRYEYFNDYEEKTEKYEKLGRDGETKKIYNFSNIIKDNENILVQNVYLKEKALNTSKIFQLFSLNKKEENKETKKEKGKEKEKGNNIKNKKLPDKNKKESLIYNKSDKNNKINKISNIENL